jgi:hypothetical protein
MEEAPRRCCLTAQSMELLFLVRRSKEKLRHTRSMGVRLLDGDRKCGSVRLQSAFVVENYARNTSGDTPFG